MSTKPFYDYVFLRDKFVKTTDANVPIMTNAIQYGTGIFAGIRGYVNKEKKFISVFRIEDHFTRFLNALKILGVSIKYDQKQLIELTIDLLKKNKPDVDVYFRPLAYAGSLGLSPNLHKDCVFDLAIYMLPLNQYLPVDKGLSVAVSSWARIQDNIIPARAKITGGYINSALARKEVEDKGYDEAIFLTQSGHVAEGSAENIFIVRDGVLITPPKSDNILEGITRRTIMELAMDMNIKVEERSIDRSELYICDEAFFSGTGVQVSWIGKIDGRVVGDGKRGKVTAKLQDLYFDVVRGNVKKYEDWCTKIKI